jgi:hypothetical protein
MPPLVVPKCKHYTLKQLATARKQCPVLYQPQVIDQMIKYYRTRQSGCHDTTRPGTVLLAGPSATGKTETYKWYTKLIFGTLQATQRNLVFRRECCNTVDDRFGLARILGAPLGTQGCEQNEGSLITFAKNLHDADFPNAHTTGIFVLEELDKTGYKAMLQQFMEILDSGEVQSRDGEVYSITKVIFIITCNGIVSDELSNSTLRNKPQRLLRVQAQAREQVCRQLCNNQASVSGRLRHIFLYIQFTVSQRRSLIQNLWYRRMFQVFKGTRGMGAFVTKRTNIQLQSSAISFFLLHWNVHTSCRSLLELFEELSLPMRDLMENRPPKAWQIQFCSERHVLVVTNGRDVSHDIPVPRPPPESMDCDDNGTQINKLVRQTLHKDIPVAKITGIHRALPVQIDASNHEQLVAWVQVVCEKLQFTAGGYEY